MDRRNDQIGIVKHPVGCFNTPSQHLVATNPKNLLAGVDLSPIAGESPDQRFRQSITPSHDAESAPEETDYYRERFAELMARIAKCPEKKWDFEEEARKMSVSLNHFNRLFRKYLGNSPRHCVIQARMRRAADLLLDSSRSVAEIAMLVGMENEFYFSRLFKKSFALSPSGYRKEFQGI